MVPKVHYEVHKSAASHYPEWHITEVYMLTNKKGKVIPVTGRGDP
jgi:hypothetical protein